MELTPAQKEVAQDNTRFRVICAGRRWGKTYLAIEEMIGKAVAENGREIAYLAPTYRQARDIAWEHLKERVNPIAEKSNERRLEVVVNTQEGGTSKIRLSSWGKVEGLRGQKFDFLVIDEVAMMDSFWVGWQEIVRPTLTDASGGAMFISTPKGFNHFYDLYNKEAESDDFKSFHFTTFDNPHIDKEELRQAERDLDDDKFAQEYKADFKKQEGLVYDEFDRQTHVVDDDRLEDERFVKEFAGIDWGYRNPSVVLTVKMNNKHEYFITNEWYKREKTDSEVIEYTTSYDYNACYPDPENTSAIEELKQKGANVREVDKSRRNRDKGLRGIDNVKEHLRECTLFVHRSCVNTIEEFESYEYEESKADRNDDERPKKENDHAMDALRYVLMTHSPSTRNDAIMQRIVQQNRGRNQSFK